MQTPHQRPPVHPFVALPKTARIYHWPFRVATPIAPSSDLRENARRVVETTIQYLTLKL